MTRLPAFAAAAALALAACGKYGPPVRTSEKPPAKPAPAAAAVQTAPESADPNAAAPAQEPQP